jgi:hypothetical protein
VSPVGVAPLLRHPIAPSARAPPPRPHPPAHWQALVDGADQSVAWAAYPGVPHAHVGQLWLHVARLRTLLRAYRGRVGAAEWLALCEDVHDVDCAGVSQEQRRAALDRLVRTHGFQAR